jgi:ankyrin repeat protein
MHAAGQGHAAIVRALQAACRYLEESRRDLLVTAIDKKGMTALMKAAARGHHRVVEALLDENAWSGNDRSARLHDYLAMKDKEGKTAMAHAEASGDSPTIKCLKDHAK